MTNIKQLEIKAINSIFFLLLMLTLSFMLNFPALGKNSQELNQQGQITINQKNYYYSPTANPNTNNPHNIIYYDQNYAPSSSLMGNYGNTPYAPSLQRNMYLDLVWSNLALREQIYIDPALAKARPKDRVMASYGSAKGIWKSPADKVKLMPASKVEKSISEQNTMPNSAQSANLNGQRVDDKLKLESGTHVLIDPGSHIVVWAGDQKTEINSPVSTMPSKVELIEIPSQSQP